MRRLLTWPLRALGFALGLLVLVLYKMIEPAEGDHRPEDPSRFWG